MEKQEITEKLKSFRDRILNDVVQAYGQRGSEFGRERFFAWRTQFSKFLDENLPGASAKLAVKLHKSVYVGNPRESALDAFMREDGELCLAFIDSLIIDVENDEFDFSPKKTIEKIMTNQTPLNNKRVFIVHGHNELIKINTARFIEKLGLEAIILHEQANKGMTIIEKIEANTDVGFAIVLYTDDDKGNTKVAAEKGELHPRARQNVIFEHGYLIAKLTRSRVVPLVSGRVELPSDIQGMVYIDDTNWQLEVAKEMKSVGYDIDMNKLFAS